jgi:hypothetical protein
VCAGGARNGGVVSVPHHVTRSELGRPSEVTEGFDGPVVHMPSTWRQVQIPLMYTKHLCARCWAALQLFLADTDTS